MRSLSKPSRKKLYGLFERGQSAAFVDHCLALLRKGYALHGFFEGAEEAFCEAVETGLAEHEKTQTGVIYLAINPVYGKEVYKIGKTRKGADARMESLASAGVLGSFVLAGSWPSQDIDRTEAHCHALFADCRIDGEFFHLHHAALARGIEQVLTEEAAAFQSLRQLLIAY